MGSHDILVGNAKQVNNKFLKKILFYDETDLFVIARKLHFRSVSKLEDKFIKQTVVCIAFYKLLRNTSAG